MSTEAGNDVCRVKLSFYETPDPDLVEAGICLHLIRLVCDLRFATPQGFKAYLMPDDATPLVLGFEGLLTRCKLVLNYPDREASLSIPSVL